MRTTLVSLALVAGLCGCSGGQDPSAAGAGGHGSTTGDMAGMAGMTGMTEVEPPAGADWNEVDATFMSMMAVHHRQAIVMSELAEDRAASPQVRTLAQGIDATQGLEVVQFATWLDQRDLPVPTVTEADDADMHAGMAGMLSAEQLDALAAADGAEFDRLYLEGMIAHHEGAIAMSEEALAAGEDERVRELAADIGAGQLGEIDRMQDLLDG